MLSVRRKGGRASSIVVVRRILERGCSTEMPSLVTAIPMQARESMPVPTISRPYSTSPSSAAAARPSGDPRDPCPRSTARPATSPRGRRGRAARRTGPAPLRNPRRAGPIGGGPPCGRGRRQTTGGRASIGGSPPHVVEDGPEAPYDRSCGTRAAGGAPHEGDGSVFAVDSCSIADQCAHRVLQALFGVRLGAEPGDEKSIPHISVSGSARPSTVSSPEPCQQRTAEEVRYPRTQRLA